MLWGFTTASAEYLAQSKTQNKGGSWKFSKCDRTIFRRHY